MKRPATLALAVLLATAAQAQMHRCPQPDGRTSYQQLPCDPPLAAPAPVPGRAAVAAAPEAGRPAGEPPRPTRRKREVLEITAQLERCRTDVPGFAEKSAVVHAAWSRRHAAVLAEQAELLALKIRVARRGEAATRLCTDEWLREVEPLTRTPDPRFSTVERTWQVFMGAVMAGDRATALSCLAGKAVARWQQRIARLTDEELRRIGATIRALKVQWGDDYEKEGVIADTDHRVVGIAFRNINEEWKISEFGGSAAPLPAP